MLVHYDPTKPILHQYDASKYGLGAMLSHIMEIIPIILWDLYQEHSTLQKEIIRSRSRRQPQ